jgi:hypothetical protein
MHKPLRRNARGIAALAACALLPSYAASAAPAGGSVPADIRAVFDKPRYKNGIWGLRVLDGTKVILDLNSQRLFYIGSVRKIFSVGQLLNAVGPRHTYDTPVYRTGPLDASGVLHGNLIVVASGDLTMGGRTNPDGTIAVSNWDHNEADGLGNAILTKPNPLAGYETLARAVAAAGIKRVAGDVVIDDRLFAPFFFRGQFYVRPIFVNDDVVDLATIPGGTVGSLANLATRPNSAALRIVNQLRVGAPKSNDTLKIDPELPACIGNAGCSATISGTLPSDYTPPLTGDRADRPHRAAVELRPNGFYRGLARLRRLGRRIGGRGESNCPASSKGRVRCGQSHCPAYRHAVRTRRKARSEDQLQHRRRHESRAAWRQEPCTFDGFRTGVRTKGPCHALGHCEQSVSLRRRQRWW